MIIRKIAPAELKVMKFIWDSDTQLASINITNIMYKKYGWKQTTTLTLLSRLINKGILSSEKIGKYTYYKAIVMRNEYINFETKEFICNVFDGSLDNFLDSLIACDQLTDKEKEYLKNWKSNLK
ncbi:TPA: BlaI/MecI/CopY family transcriptional regulator [Clostridioides difficile]|uniref:BlaI/MecI/CopY family transcriptional regulator n=1 Tax=Clostridioides difficile TaxID=1496 RepID=UPI001C1CD957|nr:BlaI/MecI/CopY family transcriptional regulator [Clostridioides difficile]MDW0092593.1 BlaI/MecI/CopY family transcriptional regulator [Clostridioides difficile]HBF4443226.1 BlaI/MecI/CopY family transcriptional regulator [Clostridioides difficile]HBG1420760.1 BlaI/MecI/CopY family transcriptional regulator [Clostridioides difficile]HBG5350122.1 BlaI/MecI/CopY family transcriptional regulator [Clostridioides difficile]